MNNRFLENGTLADSIGASLVARESLLEKMDAPAFTFDFECIGPDEKNREEYIELIAAARAARDAGKFPRAENIEKEAAKLLNSKWKENVHNTVLTAGKTDIINKYFTGSSYTAAWYMLLINITGAGIVVGDTLASHSGWTEVTPYSGSNRPTITWGTTSGGSNTASTQVISINATATVGGAGIASVATGTSGTLYSATAFATARGVANGDTLNVTPTVSVS